MKTIDIKYIKGKTIGIDAFHFIFRKIKGNGSEDETKRSLFKTIEFFETNDISVVVVFDGHNKEEAKTDECEKRHKQYNYNLNELSVKEDELKTYQKSISEKIISQLPEFNGEIIENVAKLKRELKSDGIVFDEELNVLFKQYAGLLSELEKKRKRCVFPTKQFITQIKIDLMNIGVPIYQAYKEADVVLGQLGKQNKIIGVLSEDSDMIVHGVKLLIREIDYREKKISCVSFKMILKYTEFTYEQFVECCILIGCDYSPRIKGIGPVKGFNYIKKYKNIETLLENEELKYVPENYIEHVRMARHIFIDVVDINTFYCNPDFVTFNTCSMDPNIMTIAEEIKKLRTRRITSNPLLQN